MSVGAAGPRGAGRWHRTGAASAGTPAIQLHQVPLRAAPPGPGQRRPAGLRPSPLSRYAPLGRFHPQQGGDSPGPLEQYLETVSAGAVSGRRSCVLSPHCARACQEWTYLPSEGGMPMDRRGEGWVVFAAIVLGVAGIMRIFDAIWAFRYHGALPENLEGAIFGHSLKTYGWLYLVVAAVLIVCVVPGVSAGRRSARWAGISRRRHRGASALSGGCPTTRSGR